MVASRNLTFAYNGDTSFTYPDLQCSTDRPLLITGRSGTGKTTLLHLLAGILVPTGGDIRVNDISLGSLSPSRLDKFRGRNIGIVYQRPHFMAALSVMDNILLSPYFSGQEMERSKVKDIAGRLAIGKLLSKKPARLSQGEQQRVSIARALLSGPKVLLADEPTSSLDDDNAEAVIQLLKEQSALAGSALIIVTHDERVKTHFANTIQLA
ncbi:MAG TPA: ATP-binding cassette domain-containing protein [Puia sp.]|uniref:ABC transporter ATP-binding protein n=1 Tax=Puia sp. TaxID=2045100 RepID=UPI002CDF121D|nr:ATP-binding cassette domain-containing protein [Puia sp.]HVU94699.1 ATP-binding cassette domain-containing protein [Puia sp.]